MDKFKLKNIMITHIEEYEELIDKFPDLGVIKKLISIFFYFIKFILIKERYFGYNGSR